MRLETKRLTYGGLMTALVFVATTFIPQVPIPFTEGYIHIGDSMIFVAAILLGWRYGAIAGGLGSALSDLTLGYYHWIIPTLLIKALMGAIVGYMAENSKTKVNSIFKKILSLVIGCGWLILGLSLKRLLGSSLGDVYTSDMAGRLIDEIDTIASAVELNNLVHTVQSVLGVAAIGIPLLVLILSISLRKRDKVVFGMNNLMGMTLAGLWMVMGYYVAGGILKGNMIVPIFSVPANLLQFIVGAIISFPLVLALKRTKYFQNI